VAEPVPMTYPVTATGVPQSRIEQPAEVVQDRVDWQVKALGEPWYPMAHSTVRVDWYVLAPELIM